MTKPRSRRESLWVLVLSSLLLMSCAKARATGLGPDEYETLELRYQAATGTVSFAELAEDLGYLAPIKLNYVGNSISGPQSIQTVVTGDTDFGGAFNGAIIKLVAAKAPIQAVIGYYGVDDNAWSGFYVLENSPIRSARDLIGKKISVNTLGAHSEFMLKEYLARNELSPADAAEVTLVVVPPITGEQSLRQGQVDVATLGGVFRDKALERGGLRLLFSDHQLFGKFTAGSYVLTHQFMKTHPKAAQKFVSAVAKAVEWARSTPREQVVQRFTSIIGRRKRNEDASLVGYWKSWGVAGRGGQLSDKDFKVWADWLIKDGNLRPGQVELSDVYINRLNPYAAEQ